MADNGSGNYGGNGSVWWQNVHGQGNKPDKKLRRVEQVADGNNNEHWVRARASEDEVVGHDPVDLDKVGSGNKKGRFEVTLRYTTRPPFAGAGTMRAVAIQELQELVASANAALTVLQNTPSTGDADVEVKAHVPVRQRSSIPPLAPDKWEVTVDW
jgi:hypothetical protein